MTKTRKSVLIGLIAVILTLTGYVAWSSAEKHLSQSQTFDGQRALKDVVTQVDFGPRIPGSLAHARVVEWIQAELQKAGWKSQLQTTQYAGHSIQNIIGSRTNKSPQIIIAAHYDSRIFADHDPNPKNHTQPVPGANDGASGVALLLELARTLPKDTPPIWLVFFDAEDNGRIENWDWIIGSRAFVTEMQVRPEAVVIVDMIGDADLNIYKENNSDTVLSDEIWQQAAELGYTKYFIPEYKYTILDDHIPFIQAGIPAVDIIDFDYAYWHTVADTPDKVSAESLQIVGNTLWHWIVGRNPMK